MIIFYVLFCFVMGTYSPTLEAKKETKNCKLTDALQHMHGYGDQYVLHSNCPLDPHDIISTQDNEVKFFIPIVVKDAAIKKKINEINDSAATSYYSIKMIITDEGIECSINLNPDNLQLGKALFELQKTRSITGHYGLIIKLHDTHALNTMQAKSAEKRITRLAYAEPLKKTIVVDCGHGGKDSGYSDKKGLEEKRINKMIGDRVVEELKKKITMSV